MPADDELTEETQNTELPRVQAQVEDIDQVIHELSQNRNGEILFAPFGVDDKNIQIYGKNENDEFIPVCTLRDFYEEWLAFRAQWRDFLTSAQFIQYMDSTPGADKVKLWYDTSNNQGSQTPTP